MPNHRPALIPLIMLVGSSAMAPAPASAQPKPNGESFVDNFDRLDPKRWFISDGWNNGDHQNCTWLKRNVGITDGVLKLNYGAQKTKDRAYGCAEVQTNPRYSYGTFEVRLKAAKGPGLNSSMFSYIGPVHKQPWDEIDFEILGKDPSKVQLNQYINGKGNNEKTVPVPGGADTAFNDYAFVWEKDRLRYYINGKLVQTVTDPSAIPSHPQKIYLAIWASETLKSWLGTFADPGQAVLEVDRVSYTAPGEPCQFPESVACLPQ
jgi:endo-1,3-1,4-beta-glycanase ExoK